MKIWGWNPLTNVTEQLDDLSPKEARRCLMEFVLSHRDWIVWAGLKKDGKELIADWHRLNSGRR